MADSSDPNPHESVYLEHALRVLAWHEARSEAFISRAVALLGFAGVLLALLLQVLTREGFTLGIITWLLVVGEVIALIATAGLALVVMMGRRAEAPSIDQIRTWWTQHLEGARSEDPTPSIVETFLWGTQPHADSPLETAKAAADQRGDEFKCALIALVVAIVLLGGLAIDVAART